MMPIRLSTIKSICGFNDRVEEVTNPNMAYPALKPKLRTIENNKFALKSQRRLKTISRPSSKNKRKSQSAICKIEKNEFGHYVCKEYSRLISRQYSGLSKPNINNILFKRKTWKYLIYLAGLLCLILSGAKFFFREYASTNNVKNLHKFEEDNSNATVLQPNINKRNCRSYIRRNRHKKRFRYDFLPYDIISNDNIPNTQIDKEQLDYDTIIMSNYDARQIFKNTISKRKYSLYIKPLLASLYIELDLQYGTVGFEKLMLVLCERLLSMVNGFIAKYPILVNFEFARDLKDIGNVLNSLHHFVQNEFFDKEKFHYRLEQLKIGINNFEINNKDEKSNWSLPLNYDIEHYKFTANRFITFILPKYKLLIGETAYPHDGLICNEDDGILSSITSNIMTGFSKEFDTLFNLAKPTYLETVIIRHASREINNIHLNFAKDIFGKTLHNYFSAKKIKQKSATILNDDIISHNEKCKTLTPVLLEIFYHKVIPSIEYYLSEGKYGSKSVRFKIIDAIFLALNKENNLQNNAARSYSDSLNESNLNSIISFKNTMSRFNELKCENFNKLSRFFADSLVDEAIMIVEGKACHHQLLINLINITASEQEHARRLNHGFHRVFYHYLDVIKSLNQFANRPSAKDEAKLLSQSGADIDSLPGSVFLWTKGVSNFEISLQSIEILKVEIMTIFSSLCTNNEKPYGLNIGATSSPVLFVMLEFYNQLLIQLNSMYVNDTTRKTALRLMALLEEYEMNQFDSFKKEVIRHAYQFNNVTLNDINLDSYITIVKMCNRSDNKICLADIDGINKSLLKIQLWYVHYYLVNTLEYMYSHGETGANRVHSDVIKFIIGLLNNAKTEIKDSTSFLVINFGNDKSEDFHSFIPNTRVKLVKKTAFSVKNNDTQVSEHDNLKNDTTSSSIPHIFPAIVNGLSAFAPPAAAGVVISQTHVSSTCFTPLCKILDRNKVNFTPPNNPQDLDDNDSDQINSLPDIVQFSSLRQAEALPDLEIQNRRRVFVDKIFGLGRGVKIYDINNQHTLSFGQRYPSANEFPQYIMKLGINIKLSLNQNFLMIRSMMLKLNSLFNSISSNAKLSDLDANLHNKLMHYFSKALDISDDYIIKQAVKKFLMDLDKINSFLRFMIKTKNNLHIASTELIKGRDGRFHTRLSRKQLNDIPPAFVVKGDTKSITINADCFFTDEIHNKEEQYLRETILHELTHLAVGSLDLIQLKIVSDSLLNNIEVVKKKTIAYLLDYPTTHENDFQEYLSWYLSDKSVPLARLAVPKDLINFFDKHPFLKTDMLMNNADHIVLFIYDINNLLN